MGLSENSVNDGPQSAAILRAQLGTSAAAHSRNSKVHALLWAGSEKESRFKPTRRYHFRIASYNTAGFSPFVYYNLQLKGKDKTMLYPMGNEVLEVTMEGGGVESTPENMKIYFVPPVYEYDLSKGKECTSVSLKDMAGTRMTCRTPSWVGARFDVVFWYKSGMLENIAVGSGWSLSYFPPVVERLSPAMVQQREKVDPDKNPGFHYAPNVGIVITVFGANFGKDSSDLKGFLEGASFTRQSGYPNGLPCDPLILESNTKILCTLTVKRKEAKLEGNIIIHAGIEDPQVSKAEDGKSSMKEAPAPVRVQGRISKDFDETVGTPAKEAAFKTSFASETALALGVSPARIEITELQRGSIVVIFNILADTSSTTAVSPAALAVNLAVQAADPNSALNSGSLTGALEVSLPPGTEELAAAEQATVSAETGTVAKYFSSCQPRSYTAYDMEICFNCCTYLCETGSDVPQMGGQDVLPGYRAQVCEGECMNHCGYGRSIT